MPTNQPDSEFARIGLQLVLEQLPVAVWTTDRELRITFSAGAALANLGLRPNQLVGTMLADYLGTSDPQHPTLVRHRRAIAGQSQIFESEREGRRLECRLEPLHSSDGTTIGCIGISYDVTERQQAREELRQTKEQLLKLQKLEAIGGLAGGIAHDFNNLLTVIMTCSDLVMSRLEPAAPMIAELAEIHRAGRRAADLVRQLLAVGRRQVLAPRVLNLNAVIDEMDGMLRCVTGPGVRIETQLDRDLGPVEADPTQVEQVILNLVLNARDAMPSGGRLTIETQNVTLAVRRADEFMDLAPGHYARLSIGDTGVGMDEVTRARIFEPFFTTKDPEHGTGMGLATVYGIVRQSHGQATVESHPGRGTTFHIYLPRVGAAVVAAADSPDRREITTGSETILLVDDETVVRRLVGSVLKRCGYNVLEASDGQAALELAAQHRGPLHLLVTDLVMPGLGGRQLAQQLTAERPELKVLYISGHGPDAMQRHGIDAAHVPFLQKPFFLSALAGKVRDVLDGQIAATIPANDPPAETSETQAGKPGA